MKKGILSFDFDLTLFEHDTMRITPGALEAIERLREDYYIVVASGRNMDLPESVQYQEQIRPDAVIHTNGARVTVDGQVIADHRIPGREVKKVMEAAQERGWCIGAMIGGYSYFTDEQQIIDLDIQWSGKSVRRFRPVSEVYDLPVYSMAIRGDEELINEFRRLFPQFHVPMFGGAKVTGADIVLKNVSKQKGMEPLLEYWGMTFEQVTAFGDSQNDIGILQAAGCGVAMGNADAEVKAAADMVTDDIHDDGIRKACERLGLLSHVLRVPKSSTRMQACSE